MSPTGSVLLTENEIVPCFTHLNVGSGISAWIIKTESINKKQIEKLFKNLSKNIPDRAKKRLDYLPKSINLNFFKECIFNGAKTLVKKKILKNSDLKKIEDNGNFYNFKKIEIEKFLPAELFQNCIKEFGSLGTGNTFIELTKVKQIFDKKILKKWNINQKDYILTIHSGCTAGYINLYYTPRWGIRGKNFLSFEKKKFEYHVKNMFDKKTILSKSNIFQDHQNILKLIIQVMMLTFICLP